jgi:hypothetical protein
VIRYVRFFLFIRLSDGLRRGVQPKSGANDKKNATHQFSFALHPLLSFLALLVWFHLVAIFQLDIETTGFMVL